VYTFFTAALLPGVSNDDAQSQDTRAAVSISTEFGTSPRHAATSGFLIDVPPAAQFTPAPGPVKERSASL